MAQSKQLADAWQLTTDPEFEAFYRPLTTEERSRLERNIRSNGCLDDVVVWATDGKRVIIDGHHRYEICRALGVPFGIIEADFGSRASAWLWMSEWQQGRRNLTPEELSYARGKQYEESKRGHGGSRRGSSGHDAHLKSRPTAQAIAAESGVDEKTVRRDADFAKAVDRIAQTTGDEARGKILSGEIGATKKRVIEIAKLAADEQKRLLESGDVGDTNREHVPQQPPDEKVARELEKAKDYLVRNVAQCRRREVYSKLSLWLARQVEEAG